MDVPDPVLVEALLARDGRRQRLSHTAAGPCRYAELYAESSCPWCEAEQRRPRQEPPVASRPQSEANV
ncbi:MAG: hypothetical protein GEU75_11365 [Dehalococcoidia bacterium]|nr:hypothetical protein [Dehalococcoidia bacterium]